MEDDHIILYPDLPYIGEVKGGLCHGRIVRIQGYIPADSTFFAINYQTGPSLNLKNDVALHLSPRFNERVVIRNHIKSNKWGTEEKCGPFWINRSGPFEIVILCEYLCFKIAINGGHFREFAHKFPYSRVTHLMIYGGVEVTSIFYKKIPIPKPLILRVHNPVAFDEIAPENLHYHELYLREPQGII